MKSSVRWFHLCILFLYLGAQPVCAARGLQISSDRSVLLGEDEMQITASISGFTDGEMVYIKGAFFQAGSSNYFGFTKSGDAWVKNSASNTSQRMIKIGDWDGVLVVKSDFSDSGYKGEGDYLVKVGFYYGSATSVNWSTNTLAVTVNEPDPTVTHSPSPTHTATPTQTPRPSNSLTPTLFSISNSPSPFNTPTRYEMVSANYDSTNSGTPDILGISDEHDSTHTADVSRNISTKPFVISLFLISVGCALLSGVFIWQKNGIL